MAFQLWRYCAQHSTVPIRLPPTGVAGIFGERGLRGGASGNGPYPVVPGFSSTAWPTCLRQSVGSGSSPRGTDPEGTKGRGTKGGTKGRALSRITSRPHGRWADEGTGFISHYLSTAWPTGRRGLSGILKGRALSRITSRPHGRRGLSGILKGRALSRITSTARATDPQGTGFFSHYLDRTGDEVFRGRALSRRILKGRALSRITSRPQGLQGTGFIL
jgi:hypothetical protein